ncbi:ABC transporter substrate-binding protein [Streptomyces sp. NPDC092296]|uniref:ABC transporter substrate-binding protein n=1 Tax=Streptomyces sp. NPDC092296 TaxID=3366012 RepID=UPI00380BE094
MTARPLRHRLLATGALLAAGSLALTACGSQGTAKSPADQSTTSAKAPFFDKLPADIQKSGVVKVGSEVAYAPVEFMQSGKTVGIDPDLAAALGKQLGVTFQIQNADFGTLITGLSSKRFDLAMSAMTDTKERQGSGVDFVDYFRAGTSILVKKGNPEHIQTLDDLCGRTVALQKATTNEDIAKEQAKKCAADGKGKLTIQAYAHDGEALLKIKGGGAVADLNDFPVAAYNVQTSGNGADFEVVGEQIQAGLYGIAVSKENPQLRDAVKAALDALISDGEYAKILEHWQVQQGAVTSAQLNGGS